MKVVLIGNGKMGRLVEEMCHQRSLEVVERFTSGRPLAADDGVRRRLAGVAAGIDFSRPEAVVGTVRAASELSLNLVVGTSGWQDDRERIQRLAAGAGIGIVWASNFSLGVNIFYRVTGEAAKLFSAIEAYDPFITDWHHKSKIDSPSATALELRRRLAAHYGDRDLPVVSLRAGHVPSVHAVGFDSDTDSVHLEHRARNRRGFAEGALLAARWIAGRSGFYEFREVLEELYPAAEPHYPPRTESAPSAPPPHPGADSIGG